MAADSMPNIDIRNFPDVSSAAISDYLVLSLFGGKSAKISVGLFRNIVTQGVRPIVGDGGYWYVGDINTGVLAEGKTPVFRKAETGVEFRYSSENQDAWRPLFYYSDIKLQFEDLTEENVTMLQQPASAMIEKLEEVERSLRESESDRLDKFEEIIEESSEAIADAKDTAEHPTYIGSDNYVYVWNKETKAYDKTPVYVRGESFSIKKVYPSVESMLEDQSTVFKEGDFCLVSSPINSEENARLYVRTASGSWEFLVDMSGSIGFTGKTPQLFVGGVLSGDSKGSAAVSMSPDGEDTDGNPRYRINYVLPCLAYEDLTKEQIEDLQRPASQAVKQILETEGAIKESENLRVKAEEDRESAEAERKESAEDRRKDYESIRASVLEATEAAVVSAKQARNLPKIQNGTWWLYDVDSGEYVDTGYVTSESYQLTKEEVEKVFVGDIESHTHEHLRYRAQIYNEVPDLSLLDSWADEQGVHEFYAGNEIFVCDDDEPTGYANYKYVPVVDGFTWIRIPQIPSGYKIILVKE